MLKKEFNKDKLNVKIYDNRENMGKSAADEFASCVLNLMEKKEIINIIFAAAPSQSDFLEALKEHKEIDWTRINVFHMDEYLWMDIKAPQSFAGFVKRYVADEFPVNKFYPICGENDAQMECERYSALIKNNPIDIVCLGIGENCHIAFNDPGEADFWDEAIIKIVKLDEKCRNQQVNDKCFESIDKVPLYAFTLTIPTLLRAKAIHGDNYIYDKTIYKSMSNEIIITCRKHGAFKQLATNHLKGCGCPKCNMSKLENEVKLFLEENRIIFELSYQRSLLHQQVHCMI